MAVTLQDQTEQQLDDLWRYLLAEHHEATGNRRALAHVAIMKLVAEYARRTDAWLASR